jgi:hypothetical protein
MHETSPSSEFNATPVVAPSRAIRSSWPLRGMAAVLVALGVFPLAERLDVADAQQWWRIEVHAWTVWVPAALLVVTLIAWRWPTASDALIARWRRRLLAPSPRRFALGAALATYAFAVVVSGVMFHFEPSVLDELTQLWQSHLLANGRLYALAESPPEFFSTPQTIMYAGRWFPHFPIGGPILQALGEAVHASWLVNPTLAALAAVAIYRFTSAIGDEIDARLTTALFAASPFVLIIAGSHLSEMGTLAAIWIALAMLPRWFAASDDRTASGAAAAIGLALGVATAIRPYDGAIATTTVGLFQLVSCGGESRRWRSLAIQIVVGTIPVAALLLVNHALTGDALRFAYDIVNGPEHRPGFHMTPMGYSHTPLIGLYRISSYLMRLNAVLLGWPVPVMALAAFALAAHRHVTRWENLLVGFVTVTLLAYMVYWGDGNFHGPRFLFPLVPVFLLYVARFGRRVRERVPSLLIGRTVVLLLPFWLAAAWLIPSPRLMPFGGVALTAGAAEPRDVSHDVTSAVDRVGLRHALVFVADGWQSRLTARLRAIGVTPFFAYGLATTANACTLQRRLDEAERRGLSPPQQGAFVAALANAPLDSRPVPGLAEHDLVALPRTSSFPAACQWDFDHALSHGLDLSRLMLHSSFDASGRLGGDIVYVRDFGQRDEMLRGRFGDRDWYVAAIVVEGDSLAVRLVPYAR